MKIYFSGSIRGGRQDAKLYSELIKEIKNYGRVLTEHVGSSVISEEHQIKISINKICNG